MYAWDEFFWAILCFGCFLYAVLHAPAKKDGKKDDKKADKKADKKDDSKSKAGTPRLKLAGSGKDAKKEEKKEEKKPEKKDDKGKAGPPRIKPEAIKAAMPKAVIQAKK